MISIQMKVVYDEERDRTSDEMTAELEEEIGFLYGVDSVTVEQTNTARPPSAVVSIEVDETTINPSELEFDVSTLDFLHNAMTKA